MEFWMEKPERPSLFTSEELAAHIVDTLIDHGFIEKPRFEQAVASVRWELDAQHGIGRIVLSTGVNDASRAAE
jgi:hypothetical protein